MEHFEAHTNQPPAWRLPAIIGGIVVLAGVFAFVITGTGAPAPAAAPTVAPTVEAAAGHGDFSNSPPAPAISVADAQQRWQAGQVIFVDMRSGEAYQAAHLPGALSLASPDLNQRLAALPPGWVIITYGDASRPEAGQRGAQIFRDLGYGPVAALEGGIEAWQAANLPVERP
ncbi:sulfurtransferase [Chloroflexus islandicus]|uniref:Sulfurtransferase n=1 Tax=Chloroflexus islandicus TaxID=1707952 RepID=A0A178MGI9_9CHLR|nr:rhodanese-like domain-containing protein [Chloroflexus islandicus]OAN47810.1 sulfurtransferase [Chloroflexus islandicus]